MKKSHIALLSIVLVAVFASVSAFANCGTCTAKAGGCPAMGAKDAKGCAAAQDAKTCSMAKDGKCCCVAKDGKCCDACKDGKCCCTAKDGKCCSTAKDGKCCAKQSAASKPEEKKEKSGDKKDAK